MRCSILPQIAMTRKPSPLVVDARGLACPQPVLMLRAALRDAPAGARVRLLATDPLAGVDVKAWCARSGNALVGEREGADAVEYEVEKR